MTVLAIDTAFAACQVALLAADGRLLGRYSRQMQRGQAEVLPDMLRALLEGAGCRAADLDLIAVSVGPGSFTGVRVGVAAARGLALVAGCKVAGITTLEALARAVPETVRRDGAPVLSVISARRGQVYAQAFHAGARPRPLGEPQVGDIAPLLTVLAAEGPAAWAAGDAAVQAVAGGWASAVAPGTALPAPEDLALIALADLADGRLRPPLPLYVRGPGAAVPGGRPE